MPSQHILDVETNKIVVTIRTVPCWSIVIPLTLFSAWLLLRNNGLPNHRKIRDEGILQRVEAENRMRDALRFRDADVAVGHKLWPRR